MNPTALCPFNHSQSGSVLASPGDPPPGAQNSTGLVAPPPYRPPSPAQRHGERPRPPSGRCDIEPGGSKLGSASLCILSLFGCCSPAEAGRPRACRPRFERPALTPCARWGSKSRPRSRDAAGSRCDCRLLSARTERDVTTKRGATTEATEAAGVVAPIS